MGIFISILIIILACVRLGFIMSDDWDDDVWWLLTGQKPVKWDKLDE